MASPGGATSKTLETSLSSLLLVAPPGDAMYFVPSCTMGQLNTHEYLVLVQYSAV